MSSKQKGGTNNKVLSFFVFGRTRKEMFKMNKYIKGIGIFTGGVTVGLVAGMKIAEKVITKNVMEMFDSPKARTYDTDEIIFDTTADANFVLDHMRKILEMNGYVAVGDMYDAAGLTIPDGSYDFAWTDLDDCEVAPCKYGYFIKTPNYHRIR